MSASRRLWGMPVLLGVLSVFGLGAGLLGDGVWDWVAALALATPLAVACRHVLKPPASPHR
ncbi:hypothetical protein [Massilia sp. 9096]|uniref:hypothetical protein n=1 Tax=Massilia sp. 9096 TaxID=1500894 RepID=UPI000564BA81|nr:hypothetical protein [Massilia sp. 9096]